jgi:ADP-heptose:LPS heptosyltransferase
MFSGLAASLLAWPLDLFNRLLRREKQRPPRRLFVVMHLGLGDHILNSPFVREMKRSRPDGNILLLSIYPFSALYELCPGVTVVELRDSQWMRRGLASKILFQLKLIFKIVKFRADASVAIGNYARPFLRLCIVLSLAPRRIVCSIGQTEREINALHWTVRRIFNEFLITCPQDHHVMNLSAAASCLGGGFADSSLAVWCQPPAGKESEFIDRISRHQRCVGFSLAAAAKKRKWPFYFELISMLIRELDFTVILIGREAELDDANRIQQQLGRNVDVINLPQMAASIAQTVHAIKRCSIFVGNDSGPMHLAAATGVPVMAILCHPKTGSPGHANSPNRIAPWATKYRVIQPDVSLPGCESGCRQTFPHCIATIKPDLVYQAFMDFCKECSLTF